jgi:Short C-terminal domain
VSTAPPSSGLAAPERGRADEAVNGFTTEHIVQPGPLVWQALALSQPVRTRSVDQAPPAPPADMSARLEQLKQLGELMQAGILTEAEFQQQKARILNG